MSTSIEPLTPFIAGTLHSPCIQADKFIIRLGLSCATAFALPPLSSIWAIKETLGMMPLRNWLLLMPNRRTFSSVDLGEHDNQNIFWVGKNCIFLHNLQRNLLNASNRESQNSLHKIEQVSGIITNFVS